MTEKIKILIVEHHVDDIELMQRELKKAEIDFVTEIVDTEQSYIRAVRDFIPDLILSDFSLPSFSGDTAFEIRKQIAPETPFIFVSGSIGEVASVEYIVRGVTDYVLKDKLFTLPVKVKRALSEAAARKERYRIEMELVKSENRFRALIEKSSEMITLTLIDGKVIYVSPSILKQFGYSSAEILGILIFDFIHPDDIPGFIEKRKEILKDYGKSFFNQHRMLHKNGNWIWCESTITNMLNVPGIEAVVANFRDISDRKKTEEQQEFDNNNLHALINNTNDLMWSVDLSFKLISFNQPFYETIKLVSGKEIKRDDSVFSPVLSDIQKRRFEISYLRAFSGDVFTEIEYIPHPIESWSEISYYPIHRGEAVIGTACHSRDITRRKKAEVEMDSLNSRLQLATRSASMGIWDWDIEQNYLRWDEGMHSLYKTNNLQFTSVYNEWLSKLHPEDKTRVNEDIQLAIDGTKEYDTEFRIVLDDVSIRHMKATGIIERDKKGSAIRMIGVNWDITNEKNAEKERENLIKDMIQRNRDLEQFTFIISHNLRAPTANIIGFSENLLEKTITQEEQKANLEGLSLSVSKLDSVIKDLNKILQVKRVTDEKNELISFTRLVNDIFISIGKLIDKNQVRIKPDFSEVDEINSLKGYLHSIFYNLITNSIKYRKLNESPLIEIKSRRENGKIILTFKDNGLGIDLKTKGDKIFGLYQRFHSHVDGKGMGLFMVKTQVESMGGKISIASEPNKGTEFTIEFKE